MSTVEVLEEIVSDSGLRLRGRGGIPEGGQHHHHHHCDLCLVFCHGMMLHRDAIFYPHLLQHLPIPTLAWDFSNNGDSDCAPSCPHMPILWSALSSPHPLCVSVCVCMYVRMCVCVRVCFFVCL